MKLQARQKSFKKNGQDVIFNEVYCPIEPVKGYPYELVLSFDKNGRQIVVNNLVDAELFIERSQFVNDNGEIINFDNVYVKVGVYELALKKKLTDAEKYLLKLATGTLQEKK